MNIHSTAIIDPRAELADDVEVQPYAIIGPHVAIGAGTVVGPHCVIDGRTEIGANNRFFSGAQIGVLSQDTKHSPELIGRCVIGDNNVIREFVTVSASTMSSEEEDHRVTAIGSNCLLMAYVHIAHDCRVGNSIWMANCASLAGHVEIEDHAIIGGLAGCHQFTVVGTHAFVGAMTRVTQDAAPYMIVEGNPARCVGLNSVGLRRAGFDAEARARIKQMHRVMFRSGLNTTQALHEIENSVDDSAERNHFVEFVRKSIRGLTK